MCPYWEYGYSLYAVLYTDTGITLKINVAVLPIAVCDVPLSIFVICPVVWTMYHS